MSLSSFNGGKLGCLFSKNAVMPSMKSGRNIDSCISFSARSLASKTSRIASPYTCCLITASELGAQLAAMSSAYAIARGSRSSGGHHFLDESELGGLVGEEDAAGEQQVHRGAPADDAREYPADAVLRDQTATRERRGELRAFGGEPDVAHQRLGQPDTCACAVDGGDDRLAQGRDEVRMPLTDQLGNIGLAVGAGFADRGQIAHVGAGTERPAAAGDDDGAHSRVGLGRSSSA